MILRPFIPDKDFEAVRSWVTDERMHAMWCAGRFACPLEKENFCGVLREIGNKNGDSPFVMTAEDGRAAGFFCYSLNLSTGEGMLKFVIVDPALRGKGTGKAMLKLAVEYAFSITKAEAVQLTVFPENLPALKCYEGAGFTARRTEKEAFAFRDECWSRCNMVIRKADQGCCSRGRWTVRYNELNADQYRELWESVWGEAPTREQTALGLAHSLFRVSVSDGEKVVAMARMIGDMGLCYYIKDVIVRPEYQHQGIGKLMINELLSFVQRNGIKGTEIFVELCAMPDRIPFYAQFGFSANEAQRLRIMYHVDA